MNTASGLDLLFLLRRRKRLQAGPLETIFVALFFQLSCNTFKRPFGHITLAGKWLTGFIWQALVRSSTALCFNFLFQFELFITVQSSRLLNHTNIPLIPLFFGRWFVNWLVQFYFMKNPPMCCSSRPPNLLEDFKPASKRKIYCLCILWRSVCMKRQWLEKIQYKPFSQVFGYWGKKLC